MDKEKWSNVLVEWVNCLKLCKGIQNIESLRSGEFFANLQKVITKSRHGQLDTLTFVFDLFTKHYPNYAFENKTEVHLFDLPELDLKAITSLLMHYTCIYDRKDVLTSPLCHSLSQSTQLIIRNFFQKISKDVNNETLDNIIKSCIDDASDHLSNNQWLTVESSSCKNSPLQDLLKTPVSKLGRLQEKDRIISKLKTELEAERYDKAELQEELKKQFERNKKIETQLSQKNNEISRLRAEVVALENRTPPHYQDMDSRELQRRLRSEIQSLEQYIKQIEDEQEDIRKEKDSTKELLRTAEAQAGMWEEKFFETERSFEVLREQSKKQEEDLVELQAHCAEITAMLEEYRTKPGHDSSLYDTFMGVDNAKSLNETPPCEDLACEVVEVQLREAQKQIEELREQMRQAEEVEKELRETKEEIESKLKTSEGFNAELVVKVRDTETDKVTLQNRLSEIESDLVDAKQNIQQKSTEIEELLAKLKEKSESLQKLDNDKKELHSKVSSLQSDHEKLGKELSQTMNELETQKNQLRSFEAERDNFKTISEKLQFEVADVILNNQKLCSQLETVTNEKENVLKSLNQTEINFKVLETKLFESQNWYEAVKIQLDGLHCQNNALKEELNVNKDQMTSAEEEKADLRTKLRNTKEQFDVLEKINTELKLEISDLQGQLTEALNCIETSQKHRKQLEDDQFLLEKQVSDTQSSLKKLTVAFVELQNEKEQTVKLLEANKTSRDLLEQEKSNLSSQLHHFEEVQISMTKKNEELISENVSLRDKLSTNFENLKAIKKEAKDLKQENKSLTLKLEENRSLNETLERSLSEVNLEEQKAKEMLKEAETKLQSSEEARVSFEKQLCEAKKSVEKVTKDLQEAKTEKERTMKVLEQKKTEVKLLEKEKSTFVLQLRDSEQERENLSKNNKDLEARIEDLQVQLSKTVTMLEKSKYEEMKLKEYQLSLEHQLNNANALSERMKKDLTKMKTQNKNVNKELNVTRSKLQKSEEMSLNHERQSQDLQISIKNLEKKLADVQEELKLGKEEVDRLINVRTNLESQLNEAQAVTKTLRKDLHQIECEKQGVFVELGESRESFRKIEQEKTILISKLEQSEARYKSLEQTLKMEVEELQVQLMNAGEALKANKTESNKLLNVKTKLEEQLQESHQVADAFKVKLKKLQVDNQILKEDLKESGDNIRTLRQEKEVSLKKIENLEKEKEKLLLEGTNLNEELREASHNLELFKTRSKQLEENKAVLESRLQEAQSLSESLKYDISTLQADYRRSEDECVKLQAEKATMENQLQVLKTSNNNLETKLRISEDTSESQKIHSEKLQSENRSLSEDLEQTKANAVIIENQKADLSTKLQESESKNEALTSTVTDLEKQLYEYRKILDDKKHIQEILEQKLVRLRASVEEAQLDKQKANEGLMNAKNEIQILISKLQDYELKCFTLEEKMADVINNLLISTEEHEEIRNRLESEKIILVATISEFEGKLGDLETKIQDLIRQHTNTEKENLEMMCQFEKSKEFIKQLEEEKEYIRTKLEKDKESLNLKLTELEEKMEDIRNKNQNLMYQNKILQRDLDELTVVKEEICLENQRNKESSAELLQEKQKMESVMYEERQTLTNSLSELREKSEKQLKENADLTSQNANLQQQISEIRSSKDQVELQLQSSTKFSEELAKKNEQLEVMKDDYCHKNKDLHALNDELQSQLSLLERNHQQLKNNKEIIDRQLSEVSVLSETLKAESEDVRLQYQKSKIELNETRDVLVQFTNERDNLTLSLKEANEKNDELRKDLQLIKEKLTDVENIENDTKQALLKSENEVQMLNSKNEELQKRLVDTEKKNKENQEFLEGEVNKLTSMTFAYKNELEDAMKRGDKAEQSLKDSKQEMVAINQKLERLADEKSILEKKIEVEEIISSEQKERAKSLEETVQDYEITISGLKSVVDSNLERLESLKDELTKRKDQEDDTVRTIRELLTDNDVTGGGDNDFKNFISENFRKIIKAKSEEEERVKHLEKEVKDLKVKNIETSSFTEMIEKLQVLVAEKSEISSLETLKSSFDNIHTKVNKLLKVKQELWDKLQKAETEKFELNKQFSTLKIENDEAVKAKTELTNNLKDEKQKVETLRKELENKSKPVKPEKENILNVSTKSNKSREEELKKENMMLKRKVVLTENAKNNLEKVLKELREERKKAVIPSSPTNDELYKKLLQEYIQVKEDNERVLKEKDLQIEEVKRQYDQLKIVNVPIKSEDDKKAVQDLQNIREAYGNLMSVNSKLELEMVTLRKIIEERNSEVADLSHIKEAYEKLLEENNKVLTDVDTVKYKRIRDKEEFVRLLKREREEMCNREMKRIQEIRAEYEGKLEKMKEKMLKLYREEVNKKMKSVKDGENETAKLLKTVATLKSDLFEADQKLQLLEMEKEMLKANRRMDIETRNVQLQSVSSITSITTNEERSVTLPRPSVTKEVTISKRTSIGGISTNIGAHDLHMEDEEDLFNDKYLTDLKEGRCTLPPGRDSVCRFSELAFRNSMVPPHLKSSYPAETQFISPSRFKDEDIKSGNLEFEDSLCKLLPGEKPRKKDFGTTSYKKPGPPTPSKNGGRLSLQGNEVHPMREHCEAKTPKKSTPSRIRALFTGQNSSTRDESQSNVTPSRGRRLNIFRRPR